MHSYINTLKEQNFKQNKMKNAGVFYIGVFVGAVLQNEKKNYKCFTFKTTEN